MNSTFNNGFAIVPGLNDTATPLGVSSDLPYSDYGYIPNVAQKANQLPTPNPHLSPKPAFSLTDLFHANWFTQRVHLAPLGRAHVNLK